MPVFYFDKYFNPNFPIVTNFISLILCSIYLPKLNKKIQSSVYNYYYLLICSTQFNFHFSFISVDNRWHYLKCLKENYC